MIISSTDAEALRRIRQAASLIASAIRLGADARDVASAVSAAVEEGAEQYAQDVKDDYRKAIGSQI